MSSVNRLHSWPSWTLGPRAAHPKFGGSTIVGGITRVDERLRLIKRAFPNDLTSAHLWHEVGTNLAAYAPFNSPNAVSWADFVLGIESGEYPKVAALTVPAFGLPSVHCGALLNPDSSVSEMYETMHVNAIVKTQLLKARDLGLGICIWWPAWDSKRQYHGKVEDDDAFSSADAWDYLVESWSNIVTLAERTLYDNYGIAVAGDQPLVWLEWKPEVPGQDYINTIGRAIRFCHDVNQVFGRRVMVINNEWAHLLIGGSTVEEGTRLTSEAGLFTGFFHANSADLAIVKIDEATGEVLEGTPGDDRDWYVGAGGLARLADQQAAVNLIAASGMPIVAEHDIDPQGDDPLAYYTRSREALEKMFEDAS